MDAHASASVPPVLSLENLLKLESKVQLQLLQSTSYLSSSDVSSFARLSSSIASSLSVMSTSLSSHRGLLRAGDHVGSSRLKAMQQRVDDLKETHRLTVSSHRASVSRRSLLSVKGVGLGSPSSPDKAALSSSSPSLSVEAQESQDAVEVTRSLLRTRASLSAELSRLGAVSSQIAVDGLSLRAVSDTYIDVSDIAGSARKVLRHLKNREVRERLALYGAAATFYAVGAYVVWSRLWIPFLLW